MEWYWLLAISIAVLGALALAAWVGYRVGHQDAVQKYRAQLTQHADRLTENSRPRADSNPLICEPPMVTVNGAKMTVMQWGLMTYRGRPELSRANIPPEYGIWWLIVHEMYTRASGDLGIARHFNFTDMAALQEKFTKTLVMVLDKGLRRKTISAMERVHAKYDISEAEYDRTVDVLGAILQKYKVPEEAFPAIIKITDTLRPVIAKSNAA